MGTKVTRKNCNNNTNIQRKIANHCYKERRIDEAQPGRSWPGNEKIGQRISTPQPRTGFNVLPPFATKKTHTHKYAQTWDPKTSLCLSSVVLSLWYPCLAELSLNSDNTMWNPVPSRTGHQFSAPQKQNSQVPSLVNSV